MRPPRISSANYCPASPPFFPDTSFDTFRLTQKNNILCFIPLQGKSALHRKIVGHSNGSGRIRTHELLRIFGKKFFYRKILALLSERLERCRITNNKTTKMPWTITLRIFFVGRPRLLAPYGLGVTFFRKFYFNFSMIFRVIRHFPRPPREREARTGKSVNCFTVFLHSLINHF